MDQMRKWSLVEIRARRILAESVTETLIFAENLTLAEVTAETNSFRESYRRFLPDHTTTTGPALAEIPTGLDTGTGATLAEIIAGLDKDSDGG